MKSHSKQQTRNNARGFTVLETILSLAILGIALTGIFTVFSRNAHVQSEAINKLKSARMASAILDEYVATWPAMPSQGVYKETWTWIVTEADQAPLDDTEFNQFFKFVRLTASVTHRTQNNTVYELSTVVARRAEQQ